MLNIVLPFPRDGKLRTEFLERTRILSFANKKLTQTLEKKHVVLVLMDSCAQQVLEKRVSGNSLAQEVLGALLASKLNAQLVFSAPWSVPSTKLKVAQSALLDTTVQLELLTSWLTLVLRELTALRVLLWLHAPRTPTMRLCTEDL